MKFYSAALILIVLFAASVFTADAQTSRRKKTTRRANNASVRPLPSNSAQIIEPEVISTADELENQGNGEAVVINPATGKRVGKNGKQIATTANQSNANGNSALIREVDSLRLQVKSLREKSGVDDLEKLSLAEERADNFRRKLDDTIVREAGLSAKLQELEFQIQPEAIARETAVIGSTRPEEVRENRRKILEGEKTRLRDQINQVQISRARLETAIANADALVEKLRARVEAEDGNAASTRVKSKDSEPQQPETTDDENSNPPL
jgi:hypothetical protein